MSQRTTFAVILCLATVALLAVLFFTGSLTNSKSDSVDTIADPLDVALDYYDNWLELRLATSTVVSGDQLMQPSVVSDQLAAKLTQTTSAVDIDAVLCTVDVIDSVVARIVSQTDTAAEIMVYDRTVEAATRAIVQMTVSDNAWLINDVVCSNGDIAPELPEFTFEQTGNLLRDSLSAPLDSTRWHLVYTRDGQAGNAAPLYFDATSQCVGFDGATTVCDTNSFTEPQEVTVKGQLTEGGVEVAIVEL